MQRPCLLLKPYARLSVTAVSAVEKQIGLLNVCSCGMFLSVNDILVHMKVSPNSRPTDCQCIGNRSDAKPDVSSAIRSKIIVGL